MAAATTRPLSSAAGPAQEIFELSLDDARGLADAIAWRADVEFRSGNVRETLALADSLGVIGEAPEDPDIALWPVCVAR